jgi:hypothetical protein
MSRKRAGATGQHHGRTTEPRQRPDRGGEGSGDSDRIKMTVGDPTELFLSIGKTNDGKEQRLSAYIFREFAVANGHELGTRDLDQIIALAKQTHRAVIALGDRYLNIGLRIVKPKRRKREARIDQTLEQLIAAGQAIRIEPNIIIHCRP